ncbi:glycogen/starch/alpha-glucan phosphorylase [Geobacter metallireducens RCH3]|uniref:Alpha-1,4 glucan phosphorylase n=1 Tax=Geobacter metallireducens (strain ATCC 53774 / DSM 7210 / GS-15) TaxID=269799 RepID=Q39X42_GEOMG|nr:glycogen/starch/alpha-glucan phosphorylase [Geobacter metallireducens]ABB31182.1 glycogen phosphorylase [Geobacter metallireducens GS-15]EHP84499.1 glycogen/starch/alpha-glucan phosphorylase [Geobacter metallireducens RCH3]
MTDEAFPSESGSPELDTMMLIIKSFLEHLEYTLGKDKYSATRHDIFNALAYAVRDRMVERWLDTQQAYYNEDPKRIYYVSMEFLMGKTLENSLVNLGLLAEFREAMNSLGYDLDEFIEREQDAGLGNGGLGRLAACFLDSMATMGVPGYGYGIRYEYGIFRQNIIDGSQVEIPDNWLRYRNPWEMDRQEHLHPVKFYGRVVERKDTEGNTLFDWIDTEDVMAMAYDTPIPGYGTNTVNTMRLWTAKSTREFDLSFFNEGNYIRAVEKKMLTENISKVLYPADNVPEGKELRFKQEYFLACATVHDVIYRFHKQHEDLRRLPEKAAIQLNDTHPALCIPEMMRVLIDHHRLDWETAWNITTRTFAYTNHTILPEALEKWPVWFFEHILPRHIQIIYEINDRFLTAVRTRFPGDTGKLERMSLIEEHWERKVRMANLAVVGSHSVNGVAALHTEIIKEHVFKDFFEMYPERFNNKTNGITQRRWLKCANPDQARLIGDTIGNGWTTDLYKLTQLRPLVDDPAFMAQWQQVKRTNKDKLAEYILKHNCIQVNADSLFDCQVKRIHEYKRQLLNVLHVITLYNRIKANPDGDFVPRTIIFSGKAAPAYAIAKLIIRLINAVGDVINNDSQVGDRLKVVFLANYSVSLAEKIFPAADLSEQISTAGTEASGTGNMKFALNGALTIGTLDGANIEIMEEVGRDNIFIFGMNADEVEDLRRRGYNPRDYYSRNPELKKVLDMIAEGYFFPANRDLFRPIVDSLLNQGDHYMLLADYASYVACQEEVSRLYLDREQWARKAILNCAGMGKFSSDRTIAEYAREIWDVEPFEVHPVLEYRQHDVIPD